MEENIIELKNVHKSYGSNEVVKGIDLQVKKGEFLTLLGPSGCGKTTTLRLIAGFEELSQGTIRIDGQDVSNAAPYRRMVNTVFQNYALFPNMNVFDNVAYGLKIRHRPRAEIREKVLSALDTVQLSGFEKRKINQMSGGQRQRVAIARAIVNDPKVLLLDEPLGALDFKLRKRMQLELKRLQKQLGITFIYVTHDQEEAMTMSDRVAVMHEGSIEQLDSPDGIYSRPVSRFVAAFIGESNILEAKIDRLLPDGQALACSAWGSFPCEAGQLSAGEKVFVCVRPEFMRASPHPVQGFSLEASVAENIFTGSLTRTVLQMADGKELSLITLADSPVYSLNEKVFLFWDRDKGIVMKH